MFLACLACPCAEEAEGQPAAAAAAPKPAAQPEKQLSKKVGSLAAASAPAAGKLAFKWAPASGYLTMTQFPFIPRQTAHY